MFFVGDSSDSKAVQADEVGTAHADVTYHDAKMAFLEGEIALLVEAVCLVEAAVQIDSANSHHT